ncbi:MAG: G5 domain-containing protein [Chloroflexi bacterium]|nr:G5 domain-containing protein [Chloroflexota bacterium]
MGNRFPFVRFLLILMGVSTLSLAACAAPQVTEGLITVGISADGEETSVSVPAGNTVDSTLRAAGIILEPLDKTDPPLYTVLGDGSQVLVVRVEEEFIIEQEVIPFESQVVRNESLPEGQEYWLQLGENGLREITIRRLFEDGEEVSSSPVKSIIVEEPIPQIKMVGVQRSFVPFDIPGRLVYLLDGDAWFMEGTTGNRQQLISSGDLDGRVFSLSPDGDWLLFTRTAEDEDTINTLWAAPIDQDEGQEIDLGVSNIIHFADWIPGSDLTIAYSTVEPRPGAPGWQANNDLQMLSFSPSGFIRELPEILETNSGGLYGWWGTDFSWSPDGLSLSYARPDEVGLVDLESNEQSPLKQFSPVQTFGDWAWVPSISWGPESDILYGVDHAPPADSPEYDLDVILVADGEQKVLTREVGMFAYPISSPLFKLPSEERAHQIAYLQALFPLQSETSRYNLLVMDRDGSNKKLLFPFEGAEGLEPQAVVWSPEELDDSGNRAIGLVYQNNLWIVNSVTGEAWQITGDGLTSRIDWK